MRSISKMISIALILNLLIIIPLISSELFTALVHMKKLLNTEKQVIRSIDLYLTAEEERLSKLKQMRDRYSLVNTVANKDVDSYLANPINAYTLVKRLSADWKIMKNFILTPKFIHGLQRNEAFPSDEDMKGAADALLRLQNTYKLDTKSLAEGILPIGHMRGMRDSQKDIKSSESTPLSSSDCFELGKKAYLNEDHYLTVEWMQEAMDRLDKNSTKVSDKIPILEYMAFSTYQLKNVRYALDLTRQLLELSPAHQKARKNIEYYEKELIIQSKNKKKSDAIQTPIVEIDEDNYEALCRGEKLLTDKLLSKLVCFHLNTTKIPFLRLTRIKVEEAFKKPQVVIFHDIISDSEIEVVKTLSEPKLSRATINNPLTGKLEVADYRISKSAWLQDEDHEVVDRISKRINQITGLDMTTAEALQVVNYGIGGHYETHYDFGSRNDLGKSDDDFEDDDLEEEGKRIATWMHYMSDVEAGGATVFPLLGITVWPQKSSAVFWYNLHKSGDGDYYTEHAACPVLLGSKWVSNKWIHERGQEFKKPCGLKHKEFNLVQKI